MMDTFYSYAAAIVTLVTIYYLFHWLRNRNLPPGPPTLPIIGNMHQMSSNAHLIFMNMGRTYGPMFSFELGSLPFIIITDLDIAREVLVSRGHLFADRCVLLSGKLITRNQRDIVMGSYTDLWKIHRKISQRALHMFGEGMQMLEGKMLHEIERLSEYLSDVGLEAVDASAEIDWTVFSFMCHVVFGHTYKRDDPELKKLQEALRVMTSVHYLSGILDFFPSLYFLSHIYKSSRQSALEAAVKIRDQIFDAKFSKAQREYKDGKPKNYMETLLKARSEFEDDEKGPTKELSDDHLIMSMFDIFITGTETTSSAAKWAILYMTVWPEVQEKIYQEIVELMGKESETKFVRLSHRKELPYTEAALMETLRLATVSHIGVWLKSVENANLRGYEIPKGQNLIINFYAIHHDEKYFKDPYGFHPERFLDDEGKLVKGRYQGYLPFSAGPRSCLGEPLAKAELFIIVTNIIYRFRLLPDPGIHHPDLNGIAGVHLVPKPYKVVFSSRA